MKEVYVTPADEGKISFSDLIQELSFTTKISPVTLRQEWERLISLNDNLIGIIKYLKKKGLKIVLCSDAPAEFLREILEEHNLLPLFDHIVISSEQRTTKQHQHIYKIVLAELSMKPEDVIFIDDNSNNLEVARGVGIKGVHYTEDNNLVKDLSGLLNLKFLTG